MRQVCRVREVRGGQHDRAAEIMVGCMEFEEPGANALLVKSAGEGEASEASADDTYQLWRSGGC